MISTLLNPYIIGGALSDPSGQGFYGREDIFDFVRTSLQVRQRPPILLIGQRRIGKSSILKQLPRFLPADSVCVYYDLQGKSQMELAQVLYGLGRAIADAIQIPRPERGQTTEDHFPQFLDCTIKALGGRPDRLVLLFDEFDVVDKTFTSPEIAAHRFIPYLADLITQEPRIGYVLVVGRKTEEMSEGFYSALLKDSVQRRVGCLRQHQLAQLVQEPARGVLQYSPATLDAIFCHTKGHPFCAQVLCQVIWNRHVKESATLPVSIHKGDVEAALPEAIEIGMNGLNWVYDGLEKPSHRLVLSAIAASVGESGLGTVSIHQIEQVFLAKRVGVLPLDLRSAPRELMGWDIIDAEPNGYQFSVPMIGRWIHRYRPLEDLGREVRLANPRAWRFYELGIDSQNREDWDAAIDDFQDALNANPLFIEAQVGMASSLYTRHKAGDLARSIEAYERVLELDPHWSRSPLLTVLLEGLEAEMYHVRTMTRLYRRIAELDSDGLFRDRARRHLQRMAQLRFTYGTTRYSREAMELFELLDDHEAAQLARQKYQRCNRLENIGVPIFSLSFFVLFLSSLLEGGTVINLARLTLASLGIAGIMVLSAAEHEGVLSPRVQWVGLSGFIAGWLCGYFVLRFTGSILGACFAAFFIGGGMGGVLSPSAPARPVELRFQQPPDSLKHAAARVLGKAEEQLRFWRERQPC